MATVLGPRDDAWLERALADPRVAADVWPWVADAMDARYLLGRALSQLWLEVRWRPPAGADEIQLVDEILATLRRAYPLEPGLAWPWPAWRELLELRGQPIRRRGPCSIAGRAPLVGGPAGDDAAADRLPPRSRHDHPRGLGARGPGLVHEPATAEEWSGGEAGRSVTLAGDRDRRGRPPDDGRAVPPAGRRPSRAGRDRARRRRRPRPGAARRPTRAPGVEVATVEGFSAVRGRGAAIRIEIDDPQDWKWALDTWRGLRPA